MKGLAQALTDIPNRTQTRLYADNPHEGTFCCTQCKQEIKRILFPLNKKYVIGSCKCVVYEKVEKPREEAEQRLKQGKLERFYRKNLMNERLKQATFESFQSREGTDNVHQAAKDFAENFDQKEYGLVFFGKPGNGKSHLMAAIHHKINTNGRACLFIDWSRLTNMVYDTFKKGSKESINDLINAAIDCDLLTLDEIGTGNLTDYQFKNVLYPIINGREGKLTNYTTNLDMTRLQWWFHKDKDGNLLDEDNRLYDRIVGSSDIYLNRGTSKRQEDAINRMRGA